MIPYRPSPSNRLQVCNLLELIYRAHNVCHRQKMDNVCTCRRQRTSSFDLNAQSKIYPTERWTFVIARTATVRGHAFSYVMPAWMHPQSELLIVRASYAVGVHTRYTRRLLRAVRVTVKQRTSCKTLLSRDVSAACVILDIFEFEFQRQERTTALPAFVSR
jgi:hypothetical protein